MNRRQFLLSHFIASSLVASSCSEEDKDEQIRDNEQVLTPFKGNWDYKTASFLLRRTTFGLPSKIIQESVELGMEKTIKKLLQPITPPPPPINPDFKEDIFVPIGETWVNAPYLKDVGFEQYRKKSLRAWTFENLISEEISMREQMTLFWHNYFGVSDIGEHKFEYIHIKLLREYAFGNVKELLYNITVDPSMLEFLNGNVNTKGAPNENYAREMLELYTVGKGKMLGNGDYSNFTEQDVHEMAKVLTGFQHEGFFTFNPEDNNKEVVKSHFNYKTHDNSIKHLSDKFQNASIPPLLSMEYKFLINKIFDQENTAKNICRRLYRWFVFHDINEHIENHIIQPLAKKLMEHDYELEPVLLTLLSSQHFFDAAMDKPKIKNPIEFVVGILNQFKVKQPEELATKYDFNHHLSEVCTSMGMEYFFPPSVAGWKAYYQEPLFYKFWINSATLQARKSFSDNITLSAIEVNHTKISIDPLEVLRSLNNPTNLDAIVKELIELVFVHEVSNKQKEILKNILLSEITQDEWMVNVQALLKQSGTNAPELPIVKSNILNLLNHIFNMPEFHIL